MCEEKRKEKWNKIRKGQEKQEIMIVEKYEDLVQISSIYIDIWRELANVEKLEFLKKIVKIV